MWERIRREWAYTALISDPNSNKDLIRGQLAELTPSMGKQASVSSPFWRLTKIHTHLAQSIPSGLPEAGHVIFDNISGQDDNGVRLVFPMKQGPLSNGNWGNGALVTSHRALVLFNSFPMSSIRSWKSLLVCMADNRQLPLKWFLTKYSWIGQHFLRWSKFRFFQSFCFYK